jgi:hypothetical protein
VTAASLLRPTLPALWRFLAVALPTLAALAVAMPAVDLAYHLRAGGDILDGGGIPTSDTWTFTIPGTPWTDQQWGAQVLLALVYRTTGWSGLAILRAVLVAATFGLLYAAIRRRAPAVSVRTASLLVLAAFVVAAPALALRPQLPALVLFGATLLVLADRRAHPGLVWLIPVFALAWANLHGTFPLAILLCGLAWLGDLVDRAPGRTMLGVTIASLLATLVNPFGLGAWTYVVRLATNPTIGSRVSEWRPPGITDAPGAIFWLSVLAVVALLAVRARRRRAAGLNPLPPWPALLTLGLFAALGAATGRGLAWWPLVAVFVCSGFIRDRESRPDAPTGITDGDVLGQDWRSPDPRSPDRRSPLNAIVAGVLVVACIALLPFWRPVGAAGVPDGLVSYAPQNLTRALAASASVGAHVWNPQRWGSWFELAVPSLDEAVDSRIELFPAAVWADVDQVESGTGPWADVLDRYKVKIVVTDASADGALERALASDPRWARAYADPDGSIWVRNGQLPG